MPMLDEKKQEISITSRKRAAIKKGIETFKSKKGQKTSIGDKRDSKNSSQLMRKGHLLESQLESTYCRKDHNNSNTLNKEDRVERGAFRKQRQIQLDQRFKPKDT